MEGLYSNIAPIWHICIMLFWGLFISSKVNNGALFPAHHFFIVSRNVLFVVVLGFMHILYRLCLVVHLRALSLNSRVDVGAAVFHRVTAVKSILLRLSELETL